MKPILLCDVPFTSVGWLYSMNLCAKIDDSERLDELRDDFASKCQTSVKTVVWNKKKAEFLSKVADCGNSDTPFVCIDEQPQAVEELGLLDYREAFDRNMVLFGKIMQELTSETAQLSSNIEIRTKQLSSLNPHNLNPTQVRRIMVGYATDLNKMSNVISSKAPKLSECFKIAIEGAIQMQKYSDAETKKTDREALNGLIQSMVTAKDATAESRKSISDFPDMERAQISAKKRLIQEYSNLIAVYGECITAATELLKA